MEMEHPCPSVFNFQSSLEQGRRGSGGSLKERGVLGMRDEFSDPTFYSTS